VEYEIRITNKKDFEELKPYATYSSEITGVMCFDQLAFFKGITLLDKYFKIAENSPVKKDDLKFYLDCDSKGKITLVAPDSYVAFCEGTNYSESSAFIAFKNFRELYILLKYDLVKPTENFKQYFFGMNKNSKISDLKSFNSRKEFRGDKTWTFRKYYDSEIKAGRIKVSLDDITIESCGLFSAQATSIPILNEVRGTVLDINYKEAKAQIETANGIVEVQKHGWHPFSLGWHKGSEIRLLYKKLYGDGSYKKIIDPLTLPENIDIDKNKEEFFSNFYYISNRKYPSDLLNKMYYEYKIRELIGKQESGEEVE